MAEEVKIDPFIVSAALGAAKDGAVEVTCNGEVLNGDGKVEWLDHWFVFLDRYWLRH